MITKSTSSYHPDHIVENIMVRIQAEAKLTSGKAYIEEDSEISQLAKILEGSSNTIIPLATVINHSSQYQAHLEHIADFLLDPPSAWWKKCTTGIEFFDKSGNNVGALLHTQHFHCGSFEDVALHVHECWEKCIEEEVILSATYVQHYTLKGDFQTLETTSSGDDSKTNYPNTVVTETLKPNAPKLSQTLLPEIIEAITSLETSITASETQGPQLPHSLLTVSPPSTATKTSLFPENTYTEAFST